MSMVMLTVLQLAGTFAAYLFVTIALPAFVLENRFKGHRFVERIMFYFMTGNFFVMNLVFVLQLLKISYPVTLILGTIIFTVAGRLIVKPTDVHRVFAKNFKRVSTGRMGKRTAFVKIMAILKRHIRRFIDMISRCIVSRFVDMVFLAVIFVMLWRMYGHNLIEYFGYKASDIVVHNYWINALNDNDIFVAGVYPHGFHCVVYYLHAIFGIDIYVILRIFAFVQNVMLHLMLLCFLKLCCKSRYLPYAGVILYIFGGYLQEDTYSRYYATLPQEFGFIFIFPAIYFIIEYFKCRNAEIKKDKWKARIYLPFLKKNRAKKSFYPGSWFYLTGFAMSFAMTLAVHFYGTMIAGIYCVAVAAGFCALLFRKKYFWNIIVTGLISVTIAVLPMIIAYAGGTPLQGSLKWGMNIISGSNGQDADADAQQGTADGEAEGTGEGVLGTGEGILGSGEGAAGDAEGALSGTGEGTSGYHVDIDGLEQQVSVAEGAKHIYDRIISFAQTVGGYFHKALSEDVFNIRNYDYIYDILGAFLILIAMGLVYVLLKQYYYGGILISAGLYILLLCVMLTAGNFGLPALMDTDRGSVYFTYSLAIPLVLLADSIIYLPFSFMKKRLVNVGRFLLNTLSFACVIGAVWYTVDAGWIKEPRHSTGQEPNEAVACLTNIIHNDDDFSWTIVSANDELRMGWDHGYHYELVTFLEDMEQLNSYAFIRIPTKVVYFFIEKVPIDYNVAYEKSGQSVSRTGAMRPLPANSGIHMYQGEARWILMSRMYYWAQEFGRLYPNEWDVYMETDNFVCYRIEQNPYRLYNFAIDYGYNSRTDGKGSMVNGIL